MNKLIPYIHSVFWQNMSIRIASKDYYSLDSISYQYMRIERIILITFSKIYFLNFEILKQCKFNRNLFVDHESMIGKRGNCLLISFINFASYQWKWFQLKLLYVMNKRSSWWLLRSHRRSKFLSTWFLILLILSQKA